MQYFLGFVFLLIRLPIIKEKNCDRQIYGENYSGRRMVTMKTTLMIIVAVMAVITVEVITYETYVVNPKETVIFQTKITTMVVIL